MRKNQEIYAQKKFNILKLKLYKNYTPKNFLYFKTKRLFTQLLKNFVKLA